VLFRSEAYAHEHTASAAHGTAAPSLAINVGITVETDRGIRIPVLHDARVKSLFAMARETADLIQRANQDRLRPEELGGGGFTICDLGAFEVDAFTPLIVGGQRAILGVGRIVARQIVVDADAGRLAIRRMMALSLSFDSGSLGSGAAARLLQRIKHLVEAPHLLLAF
jgi:pyruvate dehydrogenase E2 component (dihydrolipoamide acetyltransferase)